jgi:hypothetical protein
MCFLLIQMAPRHVVSGQSYAALSTLMQLWHAVVGKKMSPRALGICESTCLGRGLGSTK